MASDAHALVQVFQWLLAGVATGDPAVLLAAVESVNKTLPNSTTRLIVSALRLALPEVQGDWRRLPGQLVGRLIGYEETDVAVRALLKRVRSWPGPANGEGW